MWLEVVLGKHGRIKLVVTLHYLPGMSSGQYSKKVLSMSLTRIKLAVFSTGERLFLFCFFVFCWVFCFCSINITHMVFIGYFYCPTTSRKQPVSDVEWADRLPNARRSSPISYVAKIFAVAFWRKLLLDNLSAHKSLKRAMSHSSFP